MILAGRGSEQRKLLSSRSLPTPSSCPSAGDIRDAPMWTCSNGASPEEKKKRSSMRRIFSAIGKLATGKKQHKSKGGRETTPSPASGGYAPGRMTPNEPKKASPLPPKRMGSLQPAVASR